MRPGGKIEALARLSDPYSPIGPDDEQLFHDAMAECDAWHRERNPRYARLWRDASRPAIPVGLFKREELATPLEEGGQWLSSSGTGSRGKTRVLFDPGSLGRIELGMRQIFLRNGLMDREPANFLLLSPDPTRGQQPAYATSFAAFTACAPVNERRFAVDDDGRFQPAIAWGALREWARGTTPIFLFGLTVHFERLSLSANQPIERRAPVRGLTGGGWKGLTQTRSRDEILTALRSLLPGPTLDLRDLFGMTEHPLHYVSCREGRFHVPKFSRCQIVRADGTEAAAGEAGLIRLLNPFLASLPSHDLVTEDGGRWGSGCDCGEPLPFLRFLGRVTPPIGTCAHDASADL